MTLSGAGFAAEALSLASSVASSNAAAVAAAAEVWASCVRDGGVIHAFGTGHSQAAALEVAGRAGGLAGTSRISLVDPVLYDGAAPSYGHDLLLERDPAAGRRAYGLAGARPPDVLVVTSQSGMNGAGVEAALCARADGLPVVAVMSLAHAARVTSRHPSGSSLADVADVVLDNGAPYGDSLLEAPGGVAVAAVSSITSALLVEMVLAETCGLLVAAGVDPPVYRSNNTPGGLEWNAALDARYAGRVRRTAH